MARLFFVFLILLPFATLVSAKHPRHRRHSSSESSSRRHRGQHTTITKVNQGSDLCGCRCSCFGGRSIQRGFCECLCGCEEEETVSLEGNDSSDSNESDSSAMDSRSRGEEDFSNESYDDPEDEDSSIEDEKEDAMNDESGALIAGLIKTNFQPMFEEFVPNAIDPDFIYELDEGNSVTVEGCQGDDHYTGLVGDDDEKLKTSFYGYRQKGQDCSWPGKTFEVQTNQEITVLWDNKIPKGGHVLTGLDGTSVVDTSLHWTYSLEGYKHYTIEDDGVPMVTHLHGGHSDFQSDGNPEFFYSPDFEIKGPQWVEANYTYQDDQVAGMLWYHDHSLGLTRLNVHAGMAGLYIVRDSLDTGKPSNPLKLPTFPYELAYVIQDRMFKDNGDVFYPAFPGDPFYEDFITGEGAELPQDKFPNGGPTAIAEFFGDVMTVNGKIWPKVEVQPRNYRIRVLNGCDSRFLVVQFSKVRLGETELPEDAELLSFTVVGTDHGIANKAQTMDTLVVEPASRYDIVFDFAHLKGYRVVMRNAGPDEPYGGDPAEFGIPKEGSTFLRTDRIMAFDVVKSLDGNAPDNFDGDLIDIPPILPAPSKTRKVALFEGSDEFGRLLPLIGTAEPAADANGNPIHWPTTESTIAAGLAGKPMEGSIPWHSPTTENPRVGTTEEWEIWNVSADAHPVHLHLVFFEIIGRHSIVWDSSTSEENRSLDDQIDATGDGTYTVAQPVIKHDGAVGKGARIVNPTKGGSVDAPPEYFEDGPKDVVIAHPGEVTTIRVNFDKVGRYVWHCHILAHEDNEMMRVMQIVE